MADVTTDNLAYWVLSDKAVPVIRKDNWALSEDDIKNPAIQTQMAALDLAIKNKIGDDVEEANLDPELEGVFPKAPPDLFEDDEPMEPVDPDGAQPEADKYTPEELDEYLTAQVVLPHGGEALMAQVKARVRDKDGKPVGLHNPNPILDTRLYEVEFPDGSTEAFAANVIAENLYSQVDSQGHAFQIIRDRQSLKDG